MNLNSLEPKPVLLQRPRVRAGVGNRRAWMFCIAAALLTAAFVMPLAAVVRFALTDEVQSYILLVPLISAYLLRSSLRKTALRPSTPSRISGIVACIAGTVISAAYVSADALAIRPQDALSVAIAGYLLLLVAAALFAFGWRTLRPHTFALLFIFFFIPLPAAAIEWLSIFLQHASAEAADVFLRLTGMPVFRSDLSFKLPAITIVVAEECSGIRSTLVLFLTSLVAGQLFLKSRWRKTALVAAVIPLGILRNAFRITTIAWLTVNVDSQFVDSPLHHRGGPLFFALSLVPLFLLLFWFWRTERRKQTFREVSS